MSTPSFDPDDPRLTAYALGEADEAERRAVENWLAESPAARAEVEQTRALALALAADYAQENERYLAARANDAPPANVVAFPPAGRRRWSRAAVPILKAAAVLALTASLVYLGRRASHRPVTDAVASRTPDAPPAAPRSRSPAESLSRAADVAVAGDKDRAGSGSTDAVPLPPDAGTQATDAPGTSPASTLAMDDELKPAAASGQASRAVASVAAAPAPAMRRAAPPLPSAVAKPVAGAEVAPTNDQIARSAVRVRCPDGRFFGGVIVSPDGVILAATTLPATAVGTRCTVSLPDGSEAAAAVEPSPLGAGWYTLRTKVRGLSAAPMAASPPTDGTMLTAADVDQTSGAMTFARVRTGSTEVSKRRNRNETATTAPSVKRAGFAFDPTGKLLVFAPPASPPLALGKAAPAASPVARPLTGTERETLRQAIESGDRR